MDGMDGLAGARKNSYIFLVGSISKMDGIAQEILIDRFFLIFYFFSSKETSLEVAG